VLDERWSEDVEEVAAALTKLLSVECTPEVVRRAETSPSGLDDALETKLSEFGLQELDGRPEIFARAAYELGRFIVPTLAVECMPTLAILRQHPISLGFRDYVPASISRVAVRTEDGVCIDTLFFEGKPIRSSGGDMLVKHRSTGIGSRAGDLAVADRLCRFSALTNAARLVGGSRGLLDYGVKYARERVQFGRPIGAYQGVAHRLANAATSVDAAELLLRKAAFLACVDVAGDGAPSRIFALMLSAKAVETARFVATTIHQIFGGYGFAMDYDVQLYSRRLRSWANREPRAGGSFAEIGRALINTDERGRTQHLWHHEAGIPLPRWAREKDIK